MLVAHGEISGLNSLRTFLERQADHRHPEVGATLLKGHPPARVQRVLRDVAGQPILLAFGPAVLPAQQIDRPTAPGQQ